MPRMKQRSPIRIYVLITIACGFLAVIAHFLFDAPDQVRRYAEQRMDSAVRDAVKSEVKQATQQR